MTGYGAETSMLPSPQTTAPCCRRKAFLVALLLWTFQYSPSLAIALCRCVHWLWPDFREK
jgi:hypothetical protein